MIGRRLLALLGMTTLTALTALAAGCAHGPARPARARSVPCPKATVSVHTAKQLAVALDTARPGSVIRLSKGRYPGTFSLSSGGRADAPITVCGDSTATLDAGDIKHGYAFHVDSADWVRLVHLDVRGGQKGIVVDHSSHVTIDGVVVEHVGDEGIHFRAASKDGRVVNSVVRNTGLLDPRLGEGLYVGSAVEHWCEFSGCGPDRSDHLFVSNDTFGPDVRAEAIDVKEGTSAGVVSDSTLDGDGSTADSLIDVKGNGWTVRDVIARNVADDALKVYVRTRGWGMGTSIIGLTVDGSLSGKAVDAVGAARTTTSACRVTAPAGHGSNVACLRSG